MPPSDAVPGLVRDQLERILASRGFSRNERLSRFLRFVVERALEGKGLELKESLIGVEVFGRKPDYDPKQDSVVRTEAARLRNRLTNYYAGEGASDPIVIALPKGGYVPVFHPVATSERVQRQKPRWPPAWYITAAGITVALAFGTLYWLWARNIPVRIAVLPLQNLSPYTADEYYSDGLTSEIIRELSVIEGLTVRSQTSSFAFKGKPRAIREVGKQLDADYILEGSVLRSGRELRISVRLVRVRDDFPMWSGKFDRDVSQALAIQQELSRGIVNSLRLTLGRGRRKYETSADAYDLYLRARALQVSLPWNGADESIGPLEQAVAADRSFAPAHAALAAAYGARSNQFRNHGGDDVRKMQAAAEEAIRLDPLLAEAHDAVGMLHARHARWDDADKSFRRAIELDTNRSTTYVHLAKYLLWPLGRLQQALRQLRIAEALDPLSPQVQFDLGWMLLALGRYREAAAYCEKVPPLYTARATCIGRALFGQGKTEEAIRVLRESGASHDRANLGYVYARVGRREDAERLSIDLSPFQQAVIYAGLGNKERTLQALDRMSVVGPVRMGLILTLPELALVRDDHRLADLRRKVGLPE